MSVLALIALVAIGIVGNELLQGDAHLIMLACVAIAMIVITIASVFNRSATDEQLHT